MASPEVLPPVALKGVTNVYERAVSLSYSLPLQQRLREVAAAGGTLSSAGTLSSTGSARQPFLSSLSSVTAAPENWWGVPALLERKAVSAQSQRASVPRLRQSPAFARTWKVQEAAPPHLRPLYAKAVQREAALERAIRASELACHQRRLHTARLRQSQRLGVQHDLSDKARAGEGRRLAAMKGRDAQLRPPDRAFSIRPGADIAELDEQREWFNKNVEP